MKLLRQVWQKNLWILCTVLPRGPIGALGEVPSLFVRREPQWGQRRFWHQNSLLLNWQFKVFYKYTKYNSLISVLATINRTVPKIYSTLSTFLFEDYLRCSVDGNASSVHLSRDRNRTEFWSSLTPFMQMDKHFQSKAACGKHALKKGDMGLTLSSSRSSGYV